MFRRALLFSTLVLAACAAPPPPLPQLLRPSPGQSASWLTGTSGPIAYARHQGAALTPLHVYIEGDGFAWVTRSQPSGDPTPRGFSALDLARAEATLNPAANILYLGRPCQYLRGMVAPWPPECRTERWTADRFQPTTHALLAHAFTALVPPTTGVLLIGYSGGAAHALQLAAAYPQVQGVITLAGNLDPDTVNQWHHVTRHPGELAPLVALSRRQPTIPVSVISGADDPIIPPALTTHMLAGAALPCVTSAGIAQVTHQQGWLGWWQAHATNSAALLPACR